MAVLATDAHRVVKDGGDARQIVVAASDGACEDEGGASVAALFSTTIKRVGKCEQLAEVAMGA